MTEPDRIKTLLDGIEHARLDVLSHIEAHADTAASAERAYIDIVRAGCELLMRAAAGLRELRLDAGAAPIVREK